MTPKPREVKFIDRIVADSRDVALNHTAGLSLPQQVMMTLFGLVELMDVEKAYQKACIAICTKRFWNLIEGMGSSPIRASISTTITASSTSSSGCANMSARMSSPG